MLGSLIWSLAASISTASTVGPGYVFVSQETGTGNLSTWSGAAGKTGLAAADAICSSEAASAQLPLADLYIAFMSDSNNDLYCRLHQLGGTVANNCGQSTLPADAGPWLRRDNIPFATLATLMNPGRAIMPVLLDASGANRVGVQAYVGTRAGLTAQNTCDDWTATSGNSTVAFSDTIDIFNGSDGCSYSRALVCINLGQHTPISFARRSGRTVFLAQEHGNGDLSTWANAGGASAVAAGDKVCQNEAAAHNVRDASSFKAWLSTSSINAIDRFQNDGAWVREDGLPVAASKAALIDTREIQSVPTVIGSLLQPGDSAWTGTLANGVASSNQLCQNWTSASASDTGNIGYSLEIGEWTQFSISNCDNSSYNSLYCFSDLDRLFDSGMESIPY